MDIDIRGKVKQSLSIQMDDLLPSIIKAVKKELDLPDDAELHYTSKTTFLSFSVVKTEQDRMKCQCDNCVNSRLIQSSKRVTTEA